MVNYMRNKKGFTLIELLAVIIILGVIMLIAIPSVTRYINESRKETYIDTAKQLVKGAIPVVNSGELDMYDTNTTYYIPASCIPTENSMSSPFGEFQDAYVIVGYTGDGYVYYWASVDSAHQGIEMKEYNKLTKGDVKPNIESIDTTLGIGSRTDIKILEEESCQSFVENSSGQTAVQQISSADEVVDVADAPRYVGNEVNNFVRFNGNELWRIIGLYDNKMKIIKYDSAANMKFNEVNNHQNYWEGSDLEVYLNNTYYNNLSSVAKDMITEGVWYVGMVKDSDTRAESYEHSKAITWTGKVGLLTPYEFLYASTADNCDSVVSNQYYLGCGKSSVDWLDFRSSCKLISPHFSHNWSYFDSTISGNTGGFLYGDSVGNARDIYPVVYLKQTVKIIDGSGKISNPYILSL